MLVLKEYGKRKVFIPDMRVFVKMDTEGHEYRWVTPGDFANAEPVINKADGYYIPVKF